MSDKRWTIDDIEKALEIIKAMNYHGIRLADWDYYDIELEYLDEKKWYPKRRAAEVVYAALPRQLVKPHKIKGRK